MLLELHLSIYSLAYSIFVSKRNKREEKVRNYTGQHADKFQLTSIIYKLDFKEGELNKIVSKLDSKINCGSRKHVTSLPK